MKSQTISSPSKLSRYSPYKREYSSPKPRPQPPATSPSRKSTLEDRFDNIATATPQPYRFTFGKNRGKTLEQCDPGYIRWLTKKNVAADRPELKAALAQHQSLQTQSAPTEDVSRAPSTTTRNASTQPILSKASSPEVSPIDYVLTFGKYKGLRLKDVPDQYLRWLANNVNDFTTATPELKTGLRTLGFSTEQRPNRVPRPDWKPPIHNYAIPAFGRFQDYISGEKLWISYGEARKFFGLPQSYLDVLPRVSRVGRPRYWLYQVWDMVNVHQSRPSADAALRSFLAKNEDVTEDIWASMSLGACLCDDGY